MKAATAEPTTQAYVPRRPLLAATGLLAFWIGVLSLPMLAGRWLAGPMSDQYATGYAFRAWGAEQLRSAGAMPLWNPEIFGGLPFVAAQHGDIFYWTSWLRLVLPTDVVMNLGFVIHYVAAGVFTYLLLRMLGLRWLGAVVGGLAYQLSGIVASYPAPGHDGKLFVTALLPLTLIALIWALRRGRWEGFGLLALAVGLALLSPHYQMTYYLLIAAGLFALYLAFGEPREGSAPAKRAGLLAVALVAVLVGFGIAMVQVIPFYEYIPFSPRATGYYGFAGSVSYAIPWEHVPEFALADFVGAADTYWGSNPLKLHSEYLGLPVIALAALGVASPRRRLTAWVGGIGLLFLLISLGSATPFYRLWWAVMPFVKQTRAPGMAFYVVAFAVAIFAALGTERLERGEGRRQLTIWLVIAGTIVLLALSGALGTVPGTLATGTQGGPARPVSGAALAAIRWGAALSGVALAAVAGIALYHRRRPFRAPLFALGLVVILGADLWRNARDFWIYSASPEALYGPDPITSAIAAAPKPLRVLDLGVYPGSSLMAHGIPQMLGHHGNELHRFDELLGGKNQWTYLLRSLNLWELYAVRYVILPAGSAGDGDLPGFRRALTGVATTPGAAADLFEREEPPRYARLVPAAVKAPDERAIPTVLDPRLALDRVVILAPDAPLEPEPVGVVPQPLAATAAVEDWQPGRMRVRLSPAAPQPAYLVVSENWYPEWRATVDGVPAPVVRGNVAVITVPVEPGAEVVELHYESAAYARGKALTIASLAVAMLGLVVPPVIRRRRGRG